MHGSQKRFDKRGGEKEGRAGALRRSLVTEGLDEDLQDGTVEVHRWINDVQWIFFLQECAKT